MNFRIKAKLILRVSGGKRRSSMQEVVRKKKLVRCFKKWESYISVLKKKKKKKGTIGYFLSHGIWFTDC